MITTSHQAACPGVRADTTRHEDQDQDRDRDLLSRPRDMLRYEGLRLLSRLPPLCDLLRLLGTIKTLNTCFKTTNIYLPRPLSPPRPPRSLCFPLLISTRTRVPAIRVPSKPRTASSASLEDRLKIPVNSK